MWIRISFPERKTQNHVTYLDQTLEEIETIGITLQSPSSASLAIFPSKFLRDQQSVVSRDTLDARSLTAFSFERHYLVHMQPVIIVHFFHGLIEACP